jgi:hypothetical protein
MPGHHRDPRSVRRLLLSEVKRLHRHSPARSGHASHLPQRADQIREEHGGGLASDDVEGVVVERQRRNVALMPHEIRPYPGRHLEHRRIQIESRDVSGGPHAFRRVPGDDPGPTRDVEHVLAGSDASGIENGVHPVREQGRDEALLVELCLLGGDLSGCHGGLLRGFLLPCKVLPQAASGR